MATINQASDVAIVINTLLDDKVPVGLSHIKYIIFNKAGVLVTKELGNGITYVNGKITINLTDVDTATLSGTYTQECIARTMDGVDYFPLTARPLTINKTKVRI